MTIQSHRQLLELGAEVTLLKLDLNPIGVASVWYFCNDIGVVFNGQAYEGVPFEFSEIERNASGETIAPRISLPNTTKFASALVVEHKDAVGAELTRIKTFQRFLDTRSTTFGPDCVTHPLVEVVEGSPNGRWAKVGDTIVSNTGVPGGVFTLQTTAAVAGVKYLISFTVTNYAGHPFTLRYGDDNIGQITANGVYAIVFTVSGIGATGGSFAVYDWVGTGVNAVTISGISVKQVDVPGGTPGTMPNETADPTAIMTEDLYLLEQKVALNKIYAQWEMRALADTGDRKLPGRTCMKEICPYSYRTWDGAQFVTAKRMPCPYASLTEFRTINNAVTADPALDACDHKVDGGCKAREAGWPSGILGFGGFPGMSRYRIS